MFKISDPHIPGIILLDLMSSCSLNRVLISVLVLTLFKRSHLVALRHVSA